MIKERGNGGRKERAWEGDRGKCEGKREKDKV